MTLYAALAQPFIEFGFMRRALTAVIALAVGGGPIGSLLILRRMSLMGDAISHAVLPGVALGFLYAGLSVPAMSVGGILIGLTVALLSGLVSRFTPLREDASLAALYLISLALGVLLISLRGSSLDLLHLLFGSILGIDDAALYLVAGVSTVTLMGIALMYRPLLLDCFDPMFLGSLGVSGARIHAAFLTLVVLNLVAGFQALGTLMAIGLMMIPAVAARFWAAEIWSLFVVSIGMAIAAGYIGLLASFHFGLPSGPAIVLTGGVIYIVSVTVGPRGSLRRRIAR